ncbi:MAG: hypothetical protein IPM46_06855 [Flavobacteriales bacterium]|nr:hypothetical protein [Flavobacteriales bacterium]
MLDKEQMIFKKRRKTMTERPDVSATGNTTDNAANEALPMDGQDEQAKDPLTIASARQQPST